MSTPIKNMLVGIFILSAIVLLISVIMFLKPSVGDGKQTLYVRFSNIDNLNIGTRVLFAGKPVGEVVAMEEIRDAREQPTDELGRVYFYQLTLHIDSNVKVYNTDEVSSQTSGLLGEKSIAITPRAPPKGVTPQLVTAAEPIYADSVDPFQNAILDFSELAAQMEEAFKQLGSWIKEHGEEVASAVRSAGAALDEIDQAVSTYNQSGLIHDIQKGIKEFDATMIKTNDLMSSLNQYGLFFHMNKQWQRTHLQKTNEEEFKRECADLLRRVDEFSDSVQKIEEY